MISNLHQLSDAIASFKQAFDADDEILRHLLITVPREATYLGKRTSTAIKEEVVETPAEVAPEAEKVVDETPKEA
jgi:hypothetical protein